MMSTMTGRGLLSSQNKEKSEKFNIKKVNYDFDCLNGSTKSLKNRGIFLPENSYRYTSEKPIFTGLDVKINQL
ncbi:CLUMA_CG006545, isoform A [Clunio marinus]|uniref:CLUMA_CG006545, isoform A n=1 Tax=Clunio marinus TaxID=568069 RepID=A0A1J1HYQ1_9DIPT|nr:CLUMA_CG006545, isoform A [Clunio marinus]